MKKYPSVLPITAIEASPTNPRTYFNEEKLTQLSETMRTQGVLQRLLLRPWPGREGVFELVDGERRWRAAKLLGLEELPVDIRELTDPQVIEIQLIAGETSEPLTALEEAEGFSRALALKDGDTPVYSAESLAEKIGRHINYIYQRLSLRGLPEVARIAVQDGILPHRVASLIARIPGEADRVTATKEIVEPRHRTEPLTYNEAEALIHDRYMISLKRAVFDLRDETLGGPEGKSIACTECPFKSGNNPQLFGDVKDKNVCTSPACFRTKCQAMWDRTADQAKSDGRRVLTDVEASEVFDENTNPPQLAFDSPYVDLNAKPTYRHVANEVEDKKLPTWKRLIEGADSKGMTVPVVLARDPSGRQWELVELKLAIEAAKSVGEDIFRKDSVRTTVRGADNFADKQQAEKAKAKKQLALSLTALEVLHAALQAAWKPDAHWESIFEIALAHASSDGCWLIGKWKGLKFDSKGMGKLDTVHAWAEKVSASERQSLIPILLISQSMKWSGIMADGFKSLASDLKIDMKAIEQATAEKMKADKVGKKRGEKPVAANQAKLSELLNTKLNAAWAAAGIDGDTAKQKAIIKKALGPRKQIQSVADYDAVLKAMPPAMAGTKKAPAKKSKLKSGKKSPVREQKAQAAR